MMLGELEQIADDTAEATPQETTNDQSVANST